MKENNDLGILIPIKENNGQKAVNARDLHAFLESKQQFADWIKGRISRYDFEEGKDFEVLCFDYQGNLLNIRHHNFMKTDNQQVSKIEYALSIGMAKELSMLENNERGKQARKYFITCEEKAVSGITLPNFNNPAEAARAWALEYEAKQQALLEAKEAQDNVKRLVHDSKTYTAGEIAKDVGLRSAIELNNRLAKMEVQFKQNGTWLLYAKYADLGYTSVKQTVLDNGRIIYDRRWTGAGRDFIVSLFKEE